MFCRAFSIVLILLGAFVLAPTALAQVASLQGNVLGTDGRPLQRAEVRLEGKDKASAPISTITGSSGRYLFAALPAGVYKLSILADGAVKFSVDIKMRGEKARLDFDLSPSARKKIRNYVWVLGRTGSNLPGRWAERDAGISGPNR
jgi:Carboxypeptidase regulatory-like domain